MNAIVNQSGMMHRSLFVKTLFWGLFIFTALLPKQMSALSWSTLSHDSPSEKYSFYIGSISGADAESLPVALVFSPNPEVSSIGGGWLLPLIDSYLVPHSPYEAKCLLPCGTTVQIPIVADFESTQPRIPVKAIFKDNYAWVVYSNGTKLLYTNGAISQIQWPSGRTVQIHRVNKETVDVVLDDRKILKVARMPENKITLNFHNDDYNISFDERMPLSTNKGGQIEGLTRTISEITCNKRLALRGEVVNESGTVSSLRYLLTSPTGSFSVPLGIGRTSPIESTSNDKDFTSRFFYSGLLAGRVRKVVSGDKSSSQELRYAYAEDGTLLRATGAGRVLAKTQDGYGLTENLSNGTERITFYNKTKDNYFSITETQKQKNQ